MSIELEIPNSFKIYVLEIVNYSSVFEMKGAPCTRFAQFGGWMHWSWNLCTWQVHDFPNVLIHLYRNKHLEIVPGAWILLRMHAVCAQNKS